MFYNIILAESCYCGNLAQGGNREYLTNEEIDIQSRVLPKNRKAEVSRDFIEISIKAEETEGGYGDGGSITDYARGANNA